MIEKEIEISRFDIKEILRHDNIKTSMREI